MLALPLKLCLLVSYRPLVHALELAGLTAGYTYYERENRAYLGEGWVFRSWILVHSCRERRADRRGAAAGSSARERLRNGFGTNWPSTTGFVLRRAWTS